MWKERAQRRNDYLRSIFPKTNPVQLDDLAVENYEAIPPIFCERNPICEPNLNHLYLFRYSYGEYALINSIRGLTLKCNRKCLKKLANLLHNSLEYNRAINEFEIVRKLHNIFLRFLRLERKNAEIKVFLEIFYIVGGRPEGAFQMLQRCTLIKCFYRLIAEETIFRKDSAKILSTISQFPKVANQIICSEYFCILTGLLQAIKSSWEISELYPHLWHIIEIDPAKCMINFYFEMIFPRVLVEHINRKNALKCLALLLRCSEGQAMFDKCDYIRNIIEIIKLNDDSLNEPAIMALMNCTLSVYTVSRCREFWDLPLILLKMAYHKENSQLQLYALQAFRHIIAMPSVKIYVRRLCMSKIQDIENRFDYIQKAKEDLLCLLKTKPFININNDLPALVCESFCDIKVNRYKIQDNYDISSSSSTSGI